MAATKTRKNGLGPASRTKKETGMPETQELKAQRSQLDLESFEDVTLIKVGSFTPVTTTAEALARLANDSAKFIEVINRGLKSEEQQAMVDNSSIPWKIEDEEGNLTDYTGATADKKVVNALVLNLAKSAAYPPYEKDATAEVKRNAKDFAKNMIKTTPMILEGLKKNAAAASAAE